MTKVITFILCLMFLANTSCSSHEEIVVFANKQRIKEDLNAITKTEKSRNYLNIAALNHVAQYIFNELSEVCDTVFFQNYTVNGFEYKNVIGSLGTENSERIIIGAHYDVAGNQEGADDNASGVAGVLETARLMKGKKLKNRIDFVAYTLEEPPFFGTQNMGSYKHAELLFNNNVPVKGMICLEMIGYFNDSKNSQEYPVKILKPFYGSRGNYITVVQKSGNGKFGRQVNQLMKKQKLLPTKSFKGPAGLPGIDFSDHRNYRKFNYSAVMITNTAFYRNKNYHKPTDTIETLDIDRMALVINQVYTSILHLTESRS